MPIEIKPQVDLSNTRILVVDDELSNVRMLEQLLRKWECGHIHSTTDSRETMALYQQFEPDVVLLDLMMPMLDGFQVMEQLRAIIPQNYYLPVIVLTADISSSTRHRALAAGARDFLTKPFDIVELSLRVSNLVESCRMHKELQSQNRILDEKVLERTQALASSELETIECLAMAAEYRDDDTGQHTQRVGHTAGLLARGLNLPEDRIELIRRAAPLHDTGKIGIVDAILLKTDRLTPEEFAVMKTHAEIGHQILARHHTPSLQLAAVIAWTHHERWEGRGYPRGLEGEDIPLEGRIVSVADVFDALTHERPYKQAWPVEEAVAEITAQSGKQFDPQVVDAFRKLSHETLI